MNDLTRRQAMAALASTAISPWLSSCAGTPASRAEVTEDSAMALLDSCADNLLRLQPETATSLGIDKGQRQALRSRLADRSAAGQEAMVRTLREDLARASAVDTAGLSHETRTGLEVLKSAYRTALDLNNTYLLDGRDPNSFAGVLWCFGLHDRPWTERAIFGTVRFMNDRGLERKFDMQAYAEHVEALVAAEG